MFKNAVNNEQLNNKAIISNINESTIYVINGDKVYIT